MIVKYTEIYEFEVPIPEGEDDVDFRPLYLGPARSDQSRAVQIEQLFDQHCSALEALPEPKWCRDHSCPYKIAGWKPIERDDTGPRGRQPVMVLHLFDRSLAALFKLTFA